MLNYVCQILHTNYMNYFSYHAKLQSKIKRGELKYFEFVDEYHGISPALVLYFFDVSIFPVRDYMFEDYYKLLFKQQK